MMRLTSVSMSAACVVPRTPWPVFNVSANVSNDAGVLISAMTSTSGFR